MNKNNKGAVSTGHKETTRAAQIILEKGGNAYDAILAAFFASCVAEPVLSSLGGSGFLLSYKPTGEKVLYDFFSQTPLRKREEGELDFFPILADFGTVQQEFHIGRGSIAVPGAVKGIFEIHRDLCTLSMKEIAEPAIELARKGVKMNRFQTYTFDILEVIYRSNDKVFDLHKSPNNPNDLIREGDIFKNPDFANFLEYLVSRDDRVFYEGEIANVIANDLAEGGYLTQKDLKYYEVKKRKPLEIDYKGSLFITNPPPSAGGILIAFALNLWEGLASQGIKYGSFDQLKLLTEIMRETNKARADKLDPYIFYHDIVQKFLDPQLVRMYIENVKSRMHQNGGTTHMSVVDGKGQVASMTVTNGEGSAYIISNTGIMMNNMLGEEDLNPNGFHKFKENQRISSMMAPSILVNEKFEYAMGSGGSNRIRTAILQVILNLIDHKMDLKEAVEVSRLHFEDDKLNIEGGFSRNVVDNLEKHYSNFTEWEDKNLFFGGTHCAGYDKENDKFMAVGDSRREGCGVML